MEQRLTDRIPPHHQDAERSVLGSMLLAHEAVLLAQEMLDRRNGLEDKAVEQGVKA